MNYILTEILTEIIDITVNALNLLKPRLYEDSRSKVSLRQFFQKKHVIKIPLWLVVPGSGEKTIHCYDNVHILLQHLSDGSIQHIDQVPFYKQYIQNLTSELLDFIKKNETKLSKSSQKQIHTLSQWCLYILFLLQERRVIKKLTTTERQCWNIIRFTALLLNKAKETKSPPALAVVPHTEIKGFLTCFFDVIQQPGKLTQQLSNVLHNHQHRSILGELYTGNIWFRLNQIPAYAKERFEYQKIYNQHLALLMKQQYSGISVLPYDMLFEITAYLPLQELRRFYIAMYKYLNFSDKEQRKCLQHYHSIQEYQCTWTGTEHTDCVNSVQFSRDGKKIVSASDDNTIRLWDATTGQCLWTGKGHTSCVKSAQFSPDGKKVVSASNDNTIKLWDVTTGKCLWTGSGHTNWISSAQFSPDGSMIISASKDSSIKLWDVITGQCLWTGQEHTDEVNSAQFSPGGKKVVSASEDCTFKVWDATTRKCLWTGEGHTDCVNSAQFSPNDAKVVSVSDDRTIKLWNDTTMLHYRWTGRGRSHMIKSEFSPDSKKIVSVSYDQTIKLWDATTGKYLWTRRGHSHMIKSVQFSPDGSMIVSASYDQTIKLWDATTGKCLWTGRGHSHWIKSAQFSPDGSMIASASRDKTIKLWKLKKKEIEFKAI